MWPEPGSPLSKLAGKIRPLPWVFWLIAVPGLVLPWATGAGVKLYLQAQGRPTLPWEYFFSPDPGNVLFSILLTIFWAIPHIWLGLITTDILQGRSTSLHWATRLEKFFILGFAFVCGTVGLVVVFVSVFWEFDPLVLFVPLPGFYGLVMAFGAVIGCVIVRVSAGMKRQMKKRGTSDNSYDRDRQAPKANVIFRRGFFNTFKSDAGFTVKDRSIQGSAEYREGGRRAIVRIDNDFMQCRAYLYKDTAIKWNAPYDTEVITEEKRQEILQNVFEALRFSGGPIEMVEGLPPELSNST